MSIIHDILPLKNQMYRLALRITLSSQEAEDVVQDVMIKIWQRRDSLGEVDNLEAYALRMVRNLALDRSRMHVNQTEELTDETPTAHLHSPSPEAVLEHDERISTIRTAMERLPEKQRSCMQLRDFEGKTYREIADVMQISEEQVKVSIFRARQQIRQMLTGTGK